MESSELRILYSTNVLLMMHDEAHVCFSAVCHVKLSKIEMSHQY